jgi:hypothetical protein
MTASRPRVIVVDDFYPDPDAVRTWATRDQYRGARKYNYPGWQSRKALSSASLVRQFSEIIGAELEVQADNYTFGGFRVITAESGVTTMVHADVGPDWAGMIYLTEGLSEGCGTGFFRHKATGLEGPPSDRQARDLGYADAGSFQREVIRSSARVLADWELAQWVAPIYNRLILFRGCTLYHAPLGGHGDRVGGARLTHNFFFNERVNVGFLTIEERRVAGN